MESAFLTSSIMPLGRISSSLISLSVHFGLDTGDGDEKFSQFQNLLAHVAPNLIHLRLGYVVLKREYRGWQHEPEDIDTSPLKNIDISSCASLRSVHFCLYTGLSHWLYEANKSFQPFVLSRLLSQLPPTIQHITISLIHHRIDDMEDLSTWAAVEGIWKSIDTRLVEFNELQQVSFCQENTMEYDSWTPSHENPLSLPIASQEDIQAILPKLHASGRMKFL